MKNHSITSKTFRFGKTIILPFLLIIAGRSSAQLEILLHDALPSYWPNHIAEDFEGNVLVAGRTFIGKYNPTSGTWIWIKNILPAEGTIGDSFNADLTADGAGNSYLTGNYSGSIAFGSTVLSSAGGTSDIFVTKLDPNGNFLWAKSFGTSVGIDRSNALALDGLGNIYITGNFCNKVCSGPPQASPPEIEDIYVAKLSNSGNLVWQKRFAPGKVICDNGGIGHDIAVDASGNVYATGWFQGTFKFGNTTALTLTSQGWGDVFTIKLSTTGTALWAKAGNGAGSDRGLSLYIDTGGNVNVGGYYGNNNAAGHITFSPFTLQDVDGNAGAPGPSVSNAFLVQYTAAGNINWALNPAPVSGIHNEVKSIIADPVSALRISMPNLGMKTFSSAGIETSAMLMEDNFTMLGGYPYPKTFILDLEASASGYIFSMAGYCGTVPLANLALTNLHCLDCADWYTCNAPSNSDAFIIRSSTGGAIASPSISSRSSTEILDFDLFPNPAVDELQIRFHSTKAGISIRIYDQYGREFLTRELKEGNPMSSVLIDLPFSNGIYYISAIIGDEIKTKMFVIAR